jgi:predicted metallopeptidase
VSQASYGFDFTTAIRHVCVDMVGRLQEFAHIELDRVAISFCQTRKRVAHGRQASLTPLRFEAGAKSVTRDGTTYVCQSVVDAMGREYLYILNFYLPRFLDHAFAAKIATIVHELWHISPQFDGDLRRHAGRCYAHGASHRKYEITIEEMAQKWLALEPPHPIYAFLEKNFHELAEEYGGLYGTHVPVPKLLPIHAA